MLYDGLNRPIATNEESIKETLLGDTLMVKDSTIKYSTDELAIYYNKELGEINIWNGYNNPSIDFSLIEIDQAVKKFLSLYMEGW